MPRGTTPGPRPLPDLSNSEAWPLNLKYYTEDRFDTLASQQWRDDPTLIRFDAANALTAATPEMLVFHLTSEDALDYIVLSDFFLTFRQFITPSSLLELLMGRLAWAAKPQSALHAKETRRDVVAVRTFVLLRHWVLNFLPDDFVPSFALRSSFADALTALLGWEVARTTKTQGFGLILDQLKSCWAKACALYWDDSEEAVGGVGPGGVLGCNSLRQPGMRRSVLLYQKPVRCVLECHNHESSLVPMTEWLINGGITLSYDVESPLATQKHLHKHSEKPPSVRGLLRSWKKDFGRHKTQAISKLFPKVANTDSKHHEEDKKKVQIDVLSARAIVELEAILREKRETAIEVAPHEWECSSDSDLSLPRRQSFQSSDSSIKSASQDLPNDAVALSQFEGTATTQFAVADLGIAPAPKMTSKASLDSMPGLHMSRSWSLYCDAFETPTRRKKNMNAGLLPMDISGQNEYYIHTPFVLNYSCKNLAAQLTLIERSALAELDWKELIDLSWRKKGIVSTPAVYSWLGYVAQSTSGMQRGRGVEAVVTRSNIVVAWIQSEILLTRDKTQRVQTITHFIQIAMHSRRLQNYATVMQVVLALRAGTIRQLRSTWAGVASRDVAALDELERLVGPVRNFARLRVELTSLDPALGCVPFLGLYLSDLTFNAERPRFVAAQRQCKEENQLVNFERFRTSAAVVRALMQCIEWSRNYQLKADTDLQAKCLYVHALTELEMKGCSALLQE